MRAEFKVGKKRSQGGLSVPGLKWCVEHKGKEAAAEAAAAAEVAAAAAAEAEEQEEEDGEGGGLAECPAAL